MPDGTLAGLKWLAASRDPATDAAVEHALQGAITDGEPHDVVTAAALVKPQRLRVQFLAANDTAVRSPLARLHVPMLRIDSAVVPAPVTRQMILVPRDMVVDDSKQPAAEFEVTVDPHGYLVPEGMQVIAAPSVERAEHALAIMAHSQLPIAYVAGCPVPFRLHVTSGGPAARH